MAKSNKSIISALVANLLIAITKFAAGGISNSSAMISEGIHSMVDTVNQLLLMYGIKQGNKPADEKRPFGYGREIFFWSFIVSILIFGLGGGISIYQGIVHILHPEPLGDPFWNYVVLSASILFEGISFFIAAREFNKVREGLSWWQAIKQSKDPSLFVVLFEDGAAVSGLIVVMICVFIGHQYNNIYFDGAGSIMVGLILVFTSLVLARESRSLLMGEGIKSSTQQKIVSIISNDPAAEKMTRIYSIYISPEEALLILTIQFDVSIGTRELDTALDRFRSTIQTQFRQIKYVIIQPEFTP